MAGEQFAMVPSLAGRQATIVVDLDRAEKIGPVGLSRHGCGSIAPTHPAAIVFVAFPSALYRQSNLGAVDPLGLWSILGLCCR